MTQVPVLILLVNDRLCENYTAGVNVNENSYALSGRNTPSEGTIEKGV